MSLGLPNIDSIKELITGNLSDRLKAWIEPHAIVNAAIFLILNLALVLPPLLPALSINRNPFVASLLRLSPAWQAVLAGFTLLLFSYLINTLGTFFLSLASGDVFRKTPLIDDFFRGRQEKEFERLRELGSQTGVSGEKEAERNQAAYEFSYNFPVYKTELGLTSLANILNSPSSYIYHQYGASSEIIWPILQDKLGDKDTTAKLVQETWISLVFLSTLEILLLVVIYELLLVSRLAEIKDFPGLQMLLLLAGAVLCYYAALAKARQWSVNFRRVFDLKIGLAFSELGMKGIEKLSPVDSKFADHWQRISSWLAYGAHFAHVPKPFDVAARAEWYTPPVEDVWPQASGPDYLQIGIIQHTTDPTIQKEEKGSTTSFFRTHTFSIPVTNKSAGDAQSSGQGAYLIVKDKKNAFLPREIVKGMLLIHSDPVHIFPKLRSREISVPGTQEEAGDFSRVLFPLGDLSPGASRILTFSRDQGIAAVEVTPHAQIADVTLEMLGQGGYVIKIVPAEGASGEATLQVSYLEKEKGPSSRPEAELLHLSGESENTAGEFLNVNHTQVEWNIDLNGIKRISIHAVWEKEAL